MNDNQKIGTLLIVIAIASITILLLLSDGYGPHGFFFNISNLTIVDFSWCREDYGTPCKQTVGFVYCREGYDFSCKHVIVFTKYVLIVSVAIGTYGFLIMKKILSVPKFLCKLTNKSGVDEVRN
jgi:hypothetical protein